MVFEKYKKVVIKMKTRPEHNEKAIKAMKGREVECYDLARRVQA